MIELEISIEPVAQGRPRFSRRGGFVKAYDPPKSRKFKQELRTYVASRGVSEPLIGPLKVTMAFYRPYPQSASKAKTRAFESGELKPVTRPDLDNYVKAVLDSLNGLLWQDDNIITDIVATKRYRKKAGIYLKVEEIEC